MLNVPPSSGLKPSAIGGLGSLIGCLTGVPGRASSYGAGPLATPLSPPPFRAQAAGDRRVGVADRLLARVARPGQLVRRGPAGDRAVAAPAAAPARRQQRRRADSEGEPQTAAQQVAAMQLRPRASVPKG